MVILVMIKIRDQYARCVCVGVCVWSTTGIVWPLPICPRNESEVVFQFLLQKSVKARFVLKLMCLLIHHKHFLKIGLIMISTEVREARFGT